MKKLLLCTFILFSISSFAQRFGYVDTEYVLNSLPQYAQAQERLDMQAKNWATEIQNHQEQLDVMLVEFQNEKILLTKEQIANREQEIADKRTFIKDLQDQRYGPDGDLLSVRRNLVKPIQDQIWNAVKGVAEKRKYSFVFDKGSDLVMLYSDPKYDISEEVLRRVLPKGQEPVRGAKRDRKNSVNPLNKRNNSLNKVDKTMKVNSKSNKTKKK